MSFPHPSHPPVMPLQDHCAVLSRLLNALAFEAPAAVTIDGETLGWGQPAEWLELAASITKVEVVTAQGDHTLAYCESALDYENDRSALFSQLATSLTVFSFAWGAFESVAKIFSPPSIPRSLRKCGNDSLAARVAFALRSFTPDGAYCCAFLRLQHGLSLHPNYSSFAPPVVFPAIGPDAGQGIDLVRMIRNRFAHGVASLPRRDDWNGKDSLDNDVVRLSSRLVLFTIQMMLRVYFKGRSFVVDDYTPGSATVAFDVHAHLETLHFRSQVDGEEAGEIAE